MHGVCSAQGLFSQNVIYMIPYKVRTSVHKELEGGDKICVIDTEHMIIHIDIYLNTYTFIFV